MGHASSRQLYVSGLKRLLANRGIKVGKAQLDRFLDFVVKVCPWFPEEGTVDVELWDVVGKRLQSHYAAHGPKKVPVHIFSIWTLIRDSLDLRHESFKVEHLKAEGVSALQEHIGHPLDDVPPTNRIVDSKGPSVPPLSPTGSLARSLSEVSLDESEEKPEKLEHKEDSILLKGEEPEEPLIKLNDSCVQTVHFADQEVQTDQSVTPERRPKRVYPSLLAVTQSINEEPRKPPLGTQLKELQGAIIYMSKAMKDQSQELQSVLVWQNL